MSAMIVSPSVTGSSSVEVDSSCSAAETLWEPPSEEDVQQAIRVLALNILQCICGYGEESYVARSKHGSIESRLATAHKMLSPTSKWS
jgi:hypothetical protein